MWDWDLLFKHLSFISSIVESQAWILSQIQHIFERPEQYTAKIYVRLKDGWLFEDPSIQTGLFNETPTFNFSQPNICTRLVWLARSNSIQPMQSRQHRAAAAAGPCQQQPVWSLKMPNWAPFFSPHVSSVPFLTVWDKTTIIFISNELLCTNYAVYIQQWGQVFPKLLTIN